MIGSLQYQSPGQKATRRLIQMTSNINATGAAITTLILAVGNVQSWGIPVVNAGNVIANALYAKWWKSWHLVLNVHICANYIHNKLLFLNIR